MDSINLKLKEKQGKINAELHSQFIEHLGSCIYDGIWVGEDSDIPNYGGLRADVVDALARLAPPVIRWPGGCFADSYHWRDGVGPRDLRPITYNNNFGTASVENNHFGTHEFMELCRLVGARPWLNVNVLSGTVAEMVEWAEYCNRKEETNLSKERTTNGDTGPFEVEYWGIGNESWAGGGNYTPEGYAAEYRKYTTAFPFRKGAKMIAVGPDGNKPIERKEWTRRFFKALSDSRQPNIQAYDLHFYNWNIQNAEDNAVTYNEDGWYGVIKGAIEIEEVITEQHGMMAEGIAGFPKPEGFFPSRPVSCDLIVGEWGNWHRSDPSSSTALKQQSSIRDAITSAITLDIFHRNCGILKLACVAQTVNVLNSLILTFGKDSVLTPTYHVFDMYRAHREGEKIACDVVSAKAYDNGTYTVDGIHGFASVKNNIIALNIVNVDMKNSRKVEICLDQDVTFIDSTVLKGNSPNAFNTPENPTAVSPSKAAAPTGNGRTWEVEVPAASVSVYRFNEIT